MSALNRLRKTYAGKVSFFVIYIREAHPAGSRRPDPELDVEAPRTFDERLGVAKTCRTDLGLELPMLIDGLDDATEAAYAGWPDRLFLVDAQGRIAYRGGRGPRGFKPAELEAAIQATLGKPKPRTKAELDAIRERLKAARKASQDKR